MKDSLAPTGEGHRWLLLIHHLPPQPAYFRVKIWRRLQALGAVPVKSSVYALPHTEQTLEDFQWVLREILAQHGEGTICEARFADGLTDEQVEGLFRAARDQEYREIEQEARKVAQTLKDSGRPADAAGTEQGARLRRHFSEVVARDFFGAPGRAAAEKALGRLIKRTPGASEHDIPGGKPMVQTRGSRSKYRRRVWVTRKNIHVDRIASAWLIRRFIDPDARFRWVSEKDARTAVGELRFDMFEAEFTHRGDRCTFEVLVEEMRLSDPALGPIQEIVHDLDLKDGKFGRQETAGIQALLAGIAVPGRTDDERLAQGAALFDGLYEGFRAKARRR